MLASPTPEPDALAFWRRATIGAVAPALAVFVWASTLGTHALATRPQFIAYSVKDLPSALPMAARRVLKLPLLTWTVRTPDDRERAARYADQMIFEGFRP